MPCDPNEACSWEAAPHLPRQASHSRYRNPQRRFDTRGGMSSRASVLNSADHALDQYSSGILATSCSTAVYSPPEPHRGPHATSHQFAWAIPSECPAERGDDGCSASPGCSRRPRRGTTYAVHAPSSWSTWCTTSSANAISSAHTKRFAEPPSNAGPANRRSNCCAWESSDDPRNA